MHLRLFPEGAPAENLAALGEERRLGGLLQSCSDWYKTPCSSSNVLHCHGFLCPFHKMNPSSSDGQCCLNDAIEGLSLWLQRTLSLRGTYTGPYMDVKRIFSYGQAFFQTKGVVLVITTTLCASSRA